MKKTIIAIFAGLLMFGAASGAKAASFNLSLKPSDWNFQVTYSGSNWQPLGTNEKTPELTAEGLKFFSSSQRGAVRAISDLQTDLRNSNIYLKWKADGKNIFAHIYPRVGFDDGGLYRQPVGSYFSTGSTYNGSTVINDNTWYYTRLLITPDKQWSSITSTGNYDDLGGILFKENSGILSDEYWENYANGSAHFYIGDAWSSWYYGQETSMTIGEARFETASTPVPEPSSMILGAISFAAMGLRKRFKKIEA